MHPVPTMVNHPTKVGVTAVFLCVEVRVLRHGGGGGGVNRSLIRQEFKIADEILPSGWPISNWSVIGQ